MEHPFPAPVKQSTSLNEYIQNSCDRTYFILETLILHVLYFLSDVSDQNYYFYITIGTHRMHNLDDESAT